MLGYCNECKEMSVKVKVYVRKGNGIKCRVRFCLNKGCGFKESMFIQQESNAFCTDAADAVDAHLLK